MPYFARSTQMIQNGTHTKRTKNIFLQKNQLVMNNFKKLLLNLQCRYKLTTDILRKQPCLVSSENLDNSRYVGMRAEVVRPNVYCSARSISVERTTLYTYWCELISFLYIRVVQNPQIKNERGSHLFVPYQRETPKDLTQT